MSSETNEIKFDELPIAIKKRDPAFIDKLNQFLQQSDPSPPEDAPEGAMSFYDLKSQLTSWQIRRLEPGEERRQYRQEIWDKYLAQDFPLPSRLDLDKVILDLYQDDEEWGRQTLLQLIPQLPLKWGPWRGLKQIFKLAEKNNDYEILGALAVRMDVETPSPQYGQDVSSATTQYLCRRSWRYLRKLGNSMPALYPYAAIHFMRWIPDWSLDDWSQKSKLTKLWLTNHIFFHEHKDDYGQKKYSRNSFGYGTYWNEMPSSLSEFRAFPETWLQSPEPLLDLLLLCQADRVAQFAIELLQAHFKTRLRELSLDFLIRIGQRPLGKIQLFVKELIEENPAWQKAQFEDLGIHDLIIQHFLTSPNESVREYAIAYARDYASTLTVKKLLALLQNDEGYDDLEEFALQLLAQRDPRSELGLDVIQQLIQIEAALDLAKTKLKEGFRPSELPLDWFNPLLFQNDYGVIEFAIDYLKKEFPEKLLTTSWFQSLLADPRIEDGYYTYLVRNFALEHLQKNAAGLDADWIKQALLHPTYRWNIESWVREETVGPTQLDLDWMRTLIDPQAWRASEWVKTQKEDPKAWVKNLSYPEQLRDFAIEYISAPTRFSPLELDVEWLLSLLEHPDESCHTFANDFLLRHFNPPHFATDELLALQPQQDTSAPAEQDENPLAGKSFLFTGKLRNLTRTQAEDKVQSIDGLIAKSVTKTLDYLVVGDEGSPFFSEGKKGSKQVKAESLRDAGSAIQIISETDWLRMLTEGSASKADVDPRAITAGFQRLFSLATGEDTHELTRQFSFEYLQERHPILGPLKSGEALEGEQVIPRKMYTRDLFLPLFEDERSAVQRLAITVARFELRRWNVPASDIFSMCESPHRSIRQFALDALIGAEEQESQEDYAYPPEELDPMLVFALVESRRRQVRNTGLALVEKYYDLLGGDKHILRLAESPDRDVRSQAVKLLWMRYRQPQISLHWTPTNDQRAKVRPSRKERTPDNAALLVDFVRTVLFGISPGRLEKRPANAPQPLSNCKAKVHMIELARDLALQDLHFANELTPLFKQFLGSCHQSESMACLVAMARLDRMTNSTPDRA